VKSGFVDERFVDALSTWHMLLVVEPINHSSIRVVVLWPLRFGISSRLWGKDGTLLVASCSRWVRVGLCVGFRLGWRLASVSDAKHMYQKERFYSWKSSRSGDRRWEITGRGHFWIEEWVRDERGDRRGCYGWDYQASTGGRCGPGVMVLRMSRCVGQSALWLS
jgi:hypothetical protein